ncbi:MAG: hypothetical protein QM666_03325 [Acinetobacter sp.]
MPAFKSIILLLIMSMLLSSCCVFGYEKKTELYWGNEQWPIMKVAQVKQQCNRQAQQGYQQSRQQFEQLMRRECVKAEPFANIELIDAVTGELMSGKRQQQTLQRYRQVCSQVQPNVPLSEEMFSYYCAECTSITAFETNCYADHGLKMLHKKVLACKEMRLF